MKCLVVGLGSMGKRRIRCLKSLGFDDIIGYDPRPDRREETHKEYSIHIADNYKKIELTEVDLIIVSTPPDKHFEYVEDAIRNNIPCFVEASVILEEVERLIDLTIKNPSYVAPSCTLSYHPAIRKIRDIVKEEKYGRVTNFSYHCGQFLPDWHPWEDIRDYYVSKRETGGAREIVPFELTWLTGVFGFPQSVKGYFAETFPLGISIENSYSFSLKYPHFLGSLTVDVVSRFATRSLILNFENAQLRWNWEDNNIKLFDPKEDKWESIIFSKGRSEDGYNQNIVEDMYIDEVRDFINGITKKDEYPNSLENDRKVLKILKQLEDSDGGFNKEI